MLLDGASVEKPTGTAPKPPDFALRATSRPRKNFLTNYSKDAFNVHDVTYPLPLWERVRVRGMSFI
jgi:hypothetical protein